MEAISIQHPTSNMKRKMVRGEPFRIKHSVHGGAVLMVHKSRTPKISKAFKNGKGHTLSLSEEEVHANGEGIFGNSFDKFLQKHGAKKAVYAIGNELKPVAKTAITAGILGGASALSGLETFATGGSGAALVPAIAAGAIGLSAFANDYLDNPRKYQDTPSNNSNKIAMNDLKNAGLSKVGQLGDQYTNQYMGGVNPYNQINQITGQNLGALGTANSTTGIADSLNQQISNAQVYARDSLYSSPVMTGGLNSASILQSSQLPNPLRVDPMTGLPTEVQVQAPTKMSKEEHQKIFGYGLHHIVKRHSTAHKMRGEGVANRHGKLVEKGSVGIHGNLIRIPQALESAPFAQNFVWSSTLPPSYRRFNSTPAPTQFFVDQHI
jgi:hypothetical protein